MIHLFEKKKLKQNRVRFELIKSELSNRYIYIIVQQRAKWIKRRNHCCKHKKVKI